MVTFDNRSLSDSILTRSSRLAGVGSCSRCNAISSLNVLSQIIHGRFKLLFSSGEVSPSQRASTSSFADAANVASLVMRSRRPDALDFISRLPKSMSTDGMVPGEAYLMLRYKSCGERGDLGVQSARLQCRKCGAASRTSLVPANLKASVAFVKRLVVVRQQIECRCAVMAARRPLSRFARIVGRDAQLETPVAYRTHWTTPTKRCFSASSYLHNLNALDDRTPTV